jgi:hypothetical protein
MYQQPSILVDVLTTVQAIADIAPSTPTTYSGLFSWLAPAVAGVIMRGFFP